ncbi:MAG: ABC transporter ATP-binding protein [Filimonas sp.]|nr:ABC transporter ATP-binding protein [Filimonas sp.]
MNFLAVTGITKVERSENVLEGIHFGQQQFQKIAIAGETGSGKSTLLKIIGGLEQATSGTVHFLGEKVIGPWDKLIPGHPGIVYLSQQFELPHYLRVEQVLEYANLLPEEDAQLLYKICQIDHLMKRRTDMLSGGERQRIALAKLLITSPKLLLLDEPFSNLDMIHKQTLKQVIADLGDKLKITCIQISHDPLDNLSWADEIIVMRDGLIVQQNTPHEIYYKPVDEYVAGLFGRYNLLTPAQAALFGIVTTEKIFVRPEQFEITTSGVPVTINKVSFLGNASEVEVLSPEGIIVLNTRKQYLQKGNKINIALNRES